MEVKTATKTTNLSPRASEDYQKVLAAIEGDQKAYAFLMDRYRNSVFHMMLKMVSNREDADDLTLEAFGKAFNKLPSYAPRYAFSTWLFKIAINNCIDHIRKKRLHLLSIDDPIEPNGDSDYSNNIKSTTLDPEEKYIRQQRVMLMRTVLGKLSLKYRLMIELRFFEELSYDEIARELNIPLGTVKAQLFRAKEILFNLLQAPSAQAYLETTKRRPKRVKSRTKAKATVKAKVAVEVEAGQSS
ncbi:MAG: sigma-70 family RNA polymerase sigma factor [Bacteroidota bacterium]